MQCNTSVQYSVLVIGRLKEFFNPTRGLRQKDYLSVYLFLLCAEGLTALTNHFEVSGDLQRLNITRGVKHHKGDPRTSNLLLTDDHIIFCRSSICEWENLSLLLNHYKEVSRKTLNM